MTAKFPLGRIVATPGALSALVETGQTPLEFLGAMLRETGATCPARTGEKTKGRSLTTAASCLRRL
jgi:hypothetical protein